MLTDSSGRSIIFQLDLDPELFCKHRPQVASPKLRKIWNIEQPSRLGIDRPRDRKNKAFRRRIKFSRALGSKARRYFNDLFRVAVPRGVGLGTVKHPPGTVDGGQTKVSAAKIAR